jgi:multicomponent Na+:H+ antiporter subunit C
MEVVMALTVGVLFGCGLYMILRRNMTKIVFGVILLSHAVHLLIFIAGGLRRGGSPLVPEGQTVAPPGVTDPLPQALILTAIVISFGISAFLLVLILRTYAVLGTDDMNQLRNTEQ